MNNFTQLVRTAIDNPNKVIEFIGDFGISVTFNHKDLAINLLASDQLTFAQWLDIQRELIDKAVDEMYNIDMEQFQIQSFMYDLPVDEGQRVREQLPDEFIDKAMNKIAVKPENDWYIVKIIIKTYR